MHSAAQQIQKYFNSQPLENKICAHNLYSQKLDESLVMIMIYHYLLIMCKNNFTVSKKYSNSFIYRDSCLTLHCTNSVIGL